jgi:serine/threonine protein kinase
MTSTPSIAFVSGSPYFVRCVREGGMGVVYLLENTQSERSLLRPKYIAAKTFKSNSDLSLVRQELRNWISLRHPNILPLLSIGDIDDKLAAICPWRNDGSIAESTGTPMSSNQVKTVLTALCRALDYCWNNHNLLHLDLKPANLFFDVKRSVTEVGDWGISVVVSRLMQERKMIGDNFARGTLPYMGLERFHPGAIPAIQWDMYSLGVIAVELLSGGLPVSPDEEFENLMFSGEFSHRVRYQSKTYGQPWHNFVEALTSENIASRPNCYSSVARLIDRV